MAKCYDMPHADPSDGTDDIEVNFGGYAGPVSPPLRLGRRRETLSRERKIGILGRLGITTTEQLRAESGVDTVSLKASSANQLRMAIDQVYARLEQQGEANA